MLIDLIFRQSGWRRISFVGKSKKFSDSDLEDPITGDLYQVQIKSEANDRDFRDYAEKFSAGKYIRKGDILYSSCQEKKLVL